MKSAYYFLLFLLPVLSGCSSMYIPSPKNIPLFEEKGEVQMEAGASTNSIFATGSYAFSEKYALIANGGLSFRNFSEIYDLGVFPFNGYFEGYGAHRAAEAGIGKYNLLPSFSQWRLETFAGAGYGNTNYFDKDYKSQYLQSFLQTNIGRRTKYFELGWSFNITYSHFYCKYPEYIPQPEIMLNIKEIVYSDFGTLNFGTLMFLRFGGPHLKAFVRSGFNLAFPLSISSLITTTGLDRNYTVFHLSVGLSYRF